MRDRKRPLAFSLFTKSILVISRHKNAQDDLCSVFFSFFYFLSLEAFADFSRVRGKDREEDIVESLERLVFP